MKIKRKIAFLLRKFSSLLEEKETVAVPFPINCEKLLEGKNALITGGSGGIGIEIAKSFLKSGCNVLIAGTKEGKLEKLCTELNKYGNIQYIVLDVLNISEIENKIREAVGLLPGKKIDILVNSAGVNCQSRFFDVKEIEYDSIMDINVKGTFFMCQSVSKYMIANNIRGNILNITSSGALRPAWTPYQMSKWAIRGATLGMADTLVPYGITVNAIGPGPVATPMLNKSAGGNIYKSGQPSGRYLLPSEVGNLAVFMVSDMGRMIIGDTVYLSGGSGVISLHQ